MFRRRTSSERSPNPPSSPVDSHYGRGVAALDRGDLGRGREELLRSLQSEPVTLEHVLDVAQRLASVGFVADAEGLLRRAVQHFPERREATVALGRFLLANGHIDEAAQITVKTLIDHPGSTELHALAAQAYESAGNFPEAASHLNAVLAVDVYDAEANRRLATILERLGDRAGSIACLRRLAAFSNSEDLQALTALGIALSQDGQHGEAVDLLSEVARRRPNVSAVRADLAMAQLAGGNVREAEAGFLEALRFDPHSAQAYCGLGMAHQQLERWTEAAEAFRKTEALAPGLAAGPFNLGLTLAVLGDVTGAREAFLRALALQPGDPEIHAALQSLSPDGRPSETATDAPSARFLGDLKSFPLTELLEFLRLQNKTGSLVLSSPPRGTGIIRLVRGQITSASAPGVERFGDALVAQGIVNRQELDAIVGRHPIDDSAEALGDILMRDRPGDRDQMRRAAFEQLVQALDEMSAWTDGAFSFQPGDPGAPPAIFFDPQKVLMELMRIRDERKKAALPSQEDR